MTDLVKKYNFDTSKLDQGMLKQSVTASDGKLYSLPYSSAEWVLVYNKEIFDKFGVPYPQNGMTWDQIYDLAKRLTRQDGDAGAAVVRERLAGMENARNRFFI